MKAAKQVTILILVETPLQLEEFPELELKEFGHNPYFSGNSFATFKDTRHLKLENESQSLF